MVQSIPDPFDSYGPPKKEGQLFSILTPLAMTPDTESTSDGVAPWAGDIGIPFPQTESYSGESSSASNRLRRHSAPMASPTTQTDTTSIPTLSPTPTRRAPFPTILTVIDENRSKSGPHLSETHATSTETVAAQYASQSISKPQELPAKSPATIRVPSPYQRSERDSPSPVANGMS